MTISKSYWKSKRQEQITGVKLNTYGKVFKAGEFVKVVDPNFLNLDGETLRVCGEYGLSMVLLADNRLDPPDYFKLPRESVVKVNPVKEQKVR